MLECLCASADFRALSLGKNQIVKTCGHVQQWINGRPLAVHVSTTAVATVFVIAVELYLSGMDGYE